MPSPVAPKNPPRFELNQFQQMSPSVSNAPVEVANLADGSVSETEFQYLDGLTGNIQAQLDTIQTKYSSVFLLMGA